MEKLTKNARKVAKKRFVVAKRVILIAMLVLCCIGNVFAQDNNADEAKTKINNTVGKLLDLFSNGWVKGILCIALIAECLGLIMGGGQNPQVLKKFLPLIAGTILFMCAGKIADLVMGNTSDWNVSPTMTFVIQEEQVKLTC